MIRTSRRKAFTLVELLVVIGIIAIIAAILFPVFARERATGRRASCLSNLKQIAAANLMYAQDNDERLPSLTRVFGSNPAERCQGYGYNWGPVQAQSAGVGGLLKPPTLGLIAVNRGVALSSIVSSSNTLMFGDTQTDPFYSISIDAWFEFSGSTNAGLVHHGLFNMAYVDGHAKSMSWHAGSAPAVPFGLIVVPRNAADLDKWCIDPSAVIPSPVGLLPCDRVAPAVIARGVRWFSD